MAAAAADDAHVAAQARMYARRRTGCAPRWRRPGWSIEHSEAGLYLWATDGRPCRVTVRDLAGAGCPGGPGRVLRSGRRAARTGRADGVRRADRGGRRSTNTVTQVRAPVDARRRPADHPARPARAGAQPARRAGRLPAAARDRAPRARDHRRCGRAGAGERRADDGRRLVHRLRDRRPVRPGACPRGGRRAGRGRQPRPRRSGARRADRREPDHRVRHRRGRGVPRRGRQGAPRQEGGRGDRRLRGVDDGRGDRGQRGRGAAGGRCSAAGRTRWRCGPCPRCSRRRSWAPIAGRIPRSARGATERRRCGGPGSRGWPPASRPARR